jgi:hypothetical protein
MNLGFSGPIEAKEVDVLNDRGLMAPFGHLKRAKAPIEHFCIDGGIAG